MIGVHNIIIIYNIVLTIKSLNCLQYISVSKKIPSVRLLAVIEIPILFR